MAVKYQQLFADAQRQQAMADALQQGAMTPRQHPQGRIVSSTGGADALASIGQALMSRRTQKKATATTAQAEEAKRQAQAAALAGMSGQQDMSQGPPAPINPYARGQEAIAAGVDPNLVGAYLAQNSPKKPVELSYGAQMVDPDTGKVLAQNQRNPADSSANVPGSLQELAAINADRVARGEQPMKPEEYLAQRRGSSADSQLYAQYVQGLPEGAAPLPMDQFLLQFRSGVAGGQTRATETAKVNVEAKADLPRIEQNANQTISVVDQLLNHPGFSGIFGKSGMLQPQMIPGTDWADANALLNQVKGKTFLEAFQTLRGGGSISEIEGTKAEQAIARLERAQSDDAARLALLELKEIAQMGLQRARQKAGFGGLETGEGPPTPTGQPMPQGQSMPAITGNRRFVFDPATGSFSER